MIEQASETSASKTRLFRREKETRNTVRYTEVEVEGEAPVVGTLYVQKWFARNVEFIAVTLHHDPKDVA
jgi:hypothetical protein